MTHTEIRNRTDYGAFIPGFLDDYPLEPEEFRLYAHILRRAGSNGCFESIPNMARHCRMGEKSVKNALKLLLAAKMLVATPRPGITSVYDLTPAKEWVAAEDIASLRSEIKSSKKDKSKKTLEGVGSKMTPVKNDPGLFGVGSKMTPVKNDPSQKEPGGGVKNDRGVGSKMTYEGSTIKDQLLKEHTHEENELFFESMNGSEVCAEEEKIQAVEIEQLLESNKDGAVNNPITSQQNEPTFHEDQDPAISTKPNKRTSQVLESKGKGWQCPEPKFKEDFLHWKGAKMLQDGVRGVDKVNCYSRALGWAGRHPEEANALFLGWFASERETTPENNAPDFTKMGTLIHLELANKLSTMGLEDFVKAESWHKEWIDYVMTLRQHDFSIYNLVERFVNQN